MTIFSLATIAHAGQPTPVIEIDGRYWPLASVAPELLEPTPARGLLNLFDRWDVAEPKLVELASVLQKSPADGTIPAPGVADDFLTPLQYPSKLIMMGANYLDHMAGDAGYTAFDKASNIPVLFMKPPTTALVGSGKSVRYPRQTEKLDWEIELAVIFGKRASRVSKEDAMTYVAAYTIGIDLSARDWQMHPKHLVKFDLFGGKAFDDSCPLGPRLVPARFVNQDDLTLRLSVNGELKQNSNTQKMIWSIPEQIEAVTEHVTLEPGDVLMTGTPSGVGLKSGTFLKPGDRIDAEITGLGTLMVEIR